jgi:hypothetical protein
MIKISSEDSRLERYAYFILGLICLIVGFLRIVDDISAYFAVGTFPSIKRLLFTILCLFGGVYGCYYWFRTRKRILNKV